MSNRASFSLFPIAPPLIIVFVAALLAFVLVAAAVDTGTITGRVVDQQTGRPIAQATVLVEGIALNSITDPAGYFTITHVPAGTYTLRVSIVGYQIIIQQGVRVQSNQRLGLRFALKATSIEGDILVLKSLPPPVHFNTADRDRKATEPLPVTCVDEVLGLDVGFVKQGDQMHVRGGRSGEVLTIVDGAGPGDAMAKRSRPAAEHPASYAPCLPPGFNTEEYTRIYENEFLDVIGNPLSTFSIDVDAAAYANMRRFINAGQTPPPDAVRIEEMINYFTYDYPQPEGEHPFSITAEMSTCPWNTGHRLVHIGLQGEKVDTENLPPSNLVFLIDVSGSMRDANKLPLLKSAFRLLANELRPEDRVAMTVYAGAAGLVLPSTPGSDKDAILDALDRLQAGGSTAGAAGIQLAYQVAQNHFIEGGNNRVILATDGDFNIGVSSSSELVRMIEEKREHGVFLTVLGFGRGNLKDCRMEQLANKGNGNYAYIDNIREARKVLVSEMGGTLFTIAKDVKIQVEFNPAKIRAYRLVGYENRVLRKEDFNDDRKDAGELGSGHTVTALYEVVPADVAFAPADVDPLKYQTVGLQPEALEVGEAFTVKFRYKEPDGQTSKLITRTVSDEIVDFALASDNFRFSAAVAEFGMLLTKSKFAADASYEQVLSLARGAMGPDQQGYRHEFAALVEMSETLARAHAER